MSAGKGSRSDPQGGEKWGTDFAVPLSWFHRDRPQDLDAPLLRWQGRYASDKNRDRFSCFTRPPKLILWWIHFSFHSDELWCCIQKRDSHFFIRRCFLFDFFFNYKSVFVLIFLDGLGTSWKHDNWKCQNIYVKLFWWNEKKTKFEFKNAILAVARTTTFLFGSVSHSLNVLWHRFLQPILSNYLLTISRKIG